MTIEQVEKLLAGCDRYQLKDRSFGDSEYTWVKDNVDIAHGYCGRSACEVIINDSGEAIAGDDAYRLMKIGKAKPIEYN